MQASLPRLSCRRCTQRKLKCNKATPCSTCELSGSPCEVVERARKPRGRTKRLQQRISSSLEDRISQIETIIHDAQTAHPPVSGTPLQHATESYLATPSSSSSLTREADGFIAPEFWTALTEGVAALRETLEDSGRDEAEGIHVQGGGDPSASAAPRISNMSSLFHTLLLDQSASGRSPPPLDGHLEPDRQTLFSIYRARVDCIYKILHWPTVMNNLQSASSVQPDGQIINKPLPSSLQALQHAIFFLAYGSITDQECSSLRLGDRRLMLTFYRRSFEEILSKTNFLTLPSIVTLQAFVIYLIGLRIFSSCASSWALVATAVRQAQALRLGSEDPSRFSDYDLELRRRLLFNVGLIDAYAAMDRGTMTTMSSTLFHTFPRNINDDEMTPQFVPRESHTFCWKDTSFLIMMCEVMKCHKHMDHVCDLNKGLGEQIWTINKQRVDSLAHLFQERYSEIPSDAGPLQRFAQVSSRVMLASIRLVLHRPQCPQPSQHTPVNDSSFNVLKEALGVLKVSSHAKSKEFSPWLWKDWVPWHSLAVVLAELCMQPRHELAKEAWPVVLTSFERYRGAVADGKSGMLWRPIARLKARAEFMRNEVREDTYISDSTDQVEAQMIAPDLDLGMYTTAPFTWSSFLEDLDFLDGTFMDEFNGHST